MASEILTNVMNYWNNNYKEYDRAGQVYPISAPSDSGGWCHIPISGWPPKEGNNVETKMFYEFYIDNNADISVDFYDQGLGIYKQIENKLNSTLEIKQILDEKLIYYYTNKDQNRGRVQLYLPITSEPKLVCDYMKELIDKTKQAITEVYESKDPHVGKKGDQNMDKYIETLEKTGNIILTGAPGTGKTYLAQDIAAQLIGITETDKEKRLEQLQKSGHYDFIQFHPSYDYTDFVEGLRAEELNGQVTFKLHDGIFKNFCKRAVENFSSEKQVNNFDELYEKFVDDLLEKETSFETPTQKKKFHVEINSNRNCVAIPSTDIGTRMTLTKEMIRSYVVDGAVKDWKPYLTVVGNYFKEKYPLETKTMQNDSRPYIFVIDEINRGEISKIFGELFFSIDPGYRGIKGRVKTQYTNLIPTGDVFKSGFYIPDNVYIIGTMNDIDRSVDSFDFAMRRRFTWMEVTAAESAERMKDQLKLYPDSEKRMTSLNDAISKIPELNPSYHIGGAYFLKLAMYEGDYEKLWQYHLEPLIHEYLRGIDGSEKHIKTLKKAYNLEKTDVGTENT